NIIVGCTGETEEEFLETYKVVQGIGYAELHVFPYSQRTGTPAARMDKQISKEVKEARVNKMIELSNAQALDYAKKHENQVIEVIPEERSEERRVGKEC